MKTTGFFILISIFLSIGLVLTGLYLVIDNLIHPQGNLFEGVVIFSLGLIIVLLLGIIGSVTMAIQTFTNVFTQQVEMQQTMINHFGKSEIQKSNSIGDIIGAITGLGESSISITILETGETSIRPIREGDSIDKINDTILNALSKGMSKNPKELKDMSREQLEKELSRALKSENYEKADEIKQLIQKIDDNL